MNMWIAISLIAIVNIMFFLGVMIVIGLTMSMLIMPLYRWLSGLKHITGAVPKSRIRVKSVKKMTKTLIPKTVGANQEQFVGRDQSRSS